MSDEQKYKAALLRIVSWHEQSQVSDRDRQNLLHDIFTFADATLSGEEPELLESRP